MQVRIEDVSPVEKKLIVEVPWNAVSDRLAAAYRDLSKNVQLRGFRKGKAPRSVLQRLYGKHVNSDVVEHFLREGFATANTEHHLHAIAEPRLDDLPAIKQGQPLAFEAIVEVKGEVVAGDYKGMELTTRPQTVSDEKVSQALEELRVAHTEYVPVEGRDITARTDVITTKITGTIGDTPINEDRTHIDLTERENEPLPGLVDALIGLPINAENHEIELAIAEDHQAEHLAGKTAKLTISILEVHKKEIPELDDEFAKDLNRGETLDELRQSVREELEERNRAYARSELRDAAFKELVKRNPIPVASTLVERGVQYKYQELVAMFQQFGQSTRGLAMTDEMRVRLEPAALEMVRGELLLEALGKQENIEVSDEELQERISTMARAQGVPVARLRAELEREDNFDSVHYQVLRDKILDMLIAHATVTEVEPQADEAAAGEAGGESSEAGQGAAAGEAGGESSEAGEP